MCNDDLIRRGAIQSELRAYLIHESTEIAQHVEHLVSALPAVDPAPLIAAAVCEALDRACLAVSEHADWPEDAHGRTEQVELFARVINAIRAITTDPVAVHANMLRGTIAKPTVDQIIHLYGREAFAPMIAAAVAARLEKAAGVARGMNNGETAKAIDAAIRALIRPDEADALAEVKRQARVEGILAVNKAVSDAPNNVHRVIDDPDSPPPLDTKPDNVGHG